MAAWGWSNPFFKYVVRDSFNRADALTSTTGAIVLLIVSYWIAVGGKGVLSGDESVRSIEIAAAGFTAIWVAIIFLRACWWPFHRQLQPHDGLLPFLRARLGKYMWPVVLTVGGLLAFLVLTGVGLVWLSLQVLSNSVPMRGDTPNTVGNPDFSLLVPEGRYRFTWPSERFVNFYLRLDTERNPDISNNPAFLLRNRTNTVAYKVSAVWKSETTIDVKEEVASPRLSIANFLVTDTRLDVVSTPTAGPRANFSYYLNDTPKQTIDVIAKEAEVYFPSALWPLAAIYLAARIPEKIGDTSPPFVARITLYWETAEGKRQRAYRVKITATNAKGTSVEFPLIDAFLNFTLEEVG